LLRSWSAALFADGFWGAWAFPQVAPLALLSRPLSVNELKDLARALRDLTLAEGRDGKLRLGPVETLPMGDGLFPGSGLAPGESLPPGFALYGPALDITLSGECLSPGAKIIEVFPRPLLGCAVLRGPEKSAAVPLPDISFRAAAVANMAYGPLSAGEHSGETGYSFFWKIGELYWLSAYRQSIRRGTP
jgi:hypothetical protein